MVVEIIVIAFLRKFLLFLRLLAYARFFKNLFRTVLKSFDVDDVVVLVDLVERSVLVAVVASLSVGTVVVLVELTALLSFVGSIARIGAREFLEVFTSLEAEFLLAVSELAQLTIAALFVLEPVLAQLLLVVGVVVVIVL